MADDGRRYARTRGSEIELSALIEGIVAQFLAADRAFQRPVSAPPELRPFEAASLCSATLALACRSRELGRRIRNKRAHSWSGWWDSNPRRRPPKDRALPG
jgi:hypothetical protein